MSKSTIIAKLRVTNEQRPADLDTDPQNHPKLLRLSAVYEDKETGANQSWAMYTPSATLDVKVRPDRPSDFQDMRHGDYCFVVIERDELDRRFDATGRYKDSDTGARWHLNRLAVQGSQAESKWHCQWDHTDGLAGGEFSMTVDNRNAWAALGIDNIRIAVGCFCTMTVIPCGKDDEWPEGWPR